MCFNYTLLSMLILCKQCEINEPCTSAGTALRVARAHKPLRHGKAPGQVTKYTTIKWPTSIKFHTNLQR